MQVENKEKKQRKKKILKRIKKKKERRKSHLTWEVEGYRDPRKLDNFDVCEAFIAEFDLVRL